MKLKIKIFYEPNKKNKFERSLIFGSHKLVFFIKNVKKKPLDNHYENNKLLDDEFYHKYKISNILRIVFRKRERERKIKLIYSS
jgi:hypothetical protein